MHGNNAFSDLYSNGRYIVAHKLCDSEIRENQNNYRAYHNKSKLYAKEGNWDEAFSFIDKAINLIDEPVFFFNKGRWLITLSKYDEAIDVAEKGLNASTKYANYYYEQSLFFIKAYAELKSNRFTECENTLKCISYVSGMYLDKKIISRSLLEKKLEVNF